MKITDLVSVLQEILQDKGDLEVIVFVPPAISGGAVYLSPLDGYEVNIADNFLEYVDCPHGDDDLFLLLG